MSVYLNKRPADGLIECESTANMTNWIGEIKVGHGECVRMK